MKKIGIVLLLLGVFQLNLQAQKTEKDFYNMLDGMYSYTVPLISPADFLKKAGENYVILDTREEKEYQISHLPNAQCVGYDKVNLEAVKDLPKDQPILVYCSVGYRSERIGEKLQEMGFTHVYNLYGGIFNWSNKGEKMLDAEEASTQKVHGFNQEWSQWILKGKKVLK